MPTTLSISLASISGDAGPFTLFLRKTSDRSLINAGGDALAEIEVSTVKTGVWTATVAETIPAEDCHARIYEGTSEDAATILIDSILYSGQTEIGKQPAGGLTDHESDTLDSIAVALAGSAPVEPTGRIANGGRVLAYVGDDFTVRSGTALPIPVKDPAGGLYTLLTSIGVENLQFGASLAGKPAGLITGTIASLSQSGSGASQLCNISVEITDCGVGLKLSEDYEWQIQSTQTHDDETDSLIRLEGMLSLRRNVVA